MESDALKAAASIASQRQESIRRPVMTSETDEQFLNNMEQWVTGSLVFKREHRDRLFALARRGAAVRWRPISEAPKDGTEFWAYSQDLSGNDLPPFQSRCAWHPDAGFCTDEIRQPTHWVPLPPPPSGEPKDE